MYDTVIFYIREGMIFLEQIQGTVLALTLLVLLMQVIQLGRIRRELRAVCRKIRQYFDVITQESPQEKVENKTEATKRKEDRGLEELMLNEIRREEAQNFMEVLEDVF